MNRATENTLNKYQEKFKKQELSYDLFLTAIDDDLAEIQDLINKVKKRALNYDDLDFSEEIENLLKDMIWKMKLKDY